MSNLKLKKRKLNSETTVSIPTYKSYDINDSKESCQNKNYGTASRFKSLSIDDIKLPCVGYKEVEKSFKEHGKFIGRGSYGEVYEGLYQNQPAVAKFSGYDSIDRLANIISNR